MASKAFEVRDGYTKADGTIDVFVETNDNLDMGYPNEYATWNFKCKDRKAFDDRCGKTRVGCSGIRVFINLDGKAVR
jgi:hypothetical protein